MEMIVCDKLLSKIFSFKTWASCWLLSFHYEELLISRIRMFSRLVSKEWGLMYVYYIIHCDITSIADWKVWGE